MTMEPIKEVQKFETFRRGQIRWLERFVSRLTAKRDAKIAEARAKLSAPALRLLVAMEGEIIDAEFPEVDEDHDRVPGPEGPPLPSPRYTECALGGCGSLVATEGGICDRHKAEYEPETEPTDSRPPVEQWTDADFERNGWVKMADGNYAPPNLAKLAPEPLAPGSVIEPQEKPKRERAARRA